MSAIAATLADTDLFTAYHTYANAVSASFEEALFRAKALLARAGRETTRTGRYKKPVAVRDAVFPVGAPRRWTHCPRCGQLLQQEPSGMYCRWGCTRRFPLEGAPVAEQFEWERHSGLIGPDGHQLVSDGGFDE